MLLMASVPTMQTSSPTKSFPLLSDRDAVVSTSGIDAVSLLVQSICSLNLFDAV